MSDYTIEAITACAIPGFHALRVWISATDEPRTEEGMAEALSVRPVVAWRHVVERQAFAGEAREFRHVEPVMPDMDDWGDLADALDALEFPGGRVIVPDEAEFPDRAAFIRYALRRWSEVRFVEARKSQE
jgi:hypothetical protein